VGNESGICARDRERVYYFYDRRIIDSDSPQSVSLLTSSLVPINTCVLCVGMDRFLTDEESVTATYRVISSLTC